MSIKNLSSKAKQEIMKKCGDCTFFKVEKIRGMNPTIVAQLGKCPHHGDVHFMDEIGAFFVEFDSRDCSKFVSRTGKNK